MKQINKNIFWYSGIAAVLIYIIAITVGGMLYPGYSHISQDISQLTSTHSPIRDLMRVFFVYNLLVAVFGVGLYQISHKILAKAGSVSVVLIGLLGLVIEWFPINTRGTAITLVGQIHIVIVSIISLLTVSSGFMFWGAFKKSRLDLFAKVSLAAGISFLISGPVAAVNVMSPYAGLFERIPIGVFLLWILSSSVIMLWNKEME